MAKVLQFLISFGRLLQTWDAATENRRAPITVRCSEDQSAVNNRSTRSTKVRELLSCVDMLLTGRLIPNSHRQARPDKTVQNSPVSVVAASAMWIEFSTTQDCRRQEIRSLNTLTAIVQFTPARHWQDCFVVSGVAVWIESARPPDRCVLCRVCVGVRRAVAAVAIAAAATQASQAARPSRQTAHTQRRVRHAKCKHAVGVVTAD